MKNHENQAGKNRLLKKLLLKMKLTLTLLLFCLAGAAASTYSQNTRLNVKLEGGNMVELIKQIEANSEYFFYYQKEELKELDNLTLEAKGATVTEILDQVTKGTHFEYTVIDRYIVLRKTGDDFGDEFLKSAKNAAVQQGSVSGEVTDSGNQPLPGVTVVVKGTTQGTVTNADGEYSLTNIPEDATLVFSFVGMRTLEVVVGNQIRIDISMEEETIGLDEVVAIGYGTMRKSDLTGAVSSVKIEEYAQSVSPSMENLLLGKAAGVRISQSSGEPGGGFTVNIRGASSINAGNEPLYVIDGVPISNERNITGTGTRIGSRPSARSPLASINPSDIESISILKDASATAIYGSRGANGVIIINTKTGRANTLRLDYHGYLGISQPSNKLNLLSPDEYYEVFNSIIEDSDVYDDQYLVPEVKHRTDWQDELTDKSAFTQNHQLSFSGGTEASTYYLSFNYMDQEGVMRNTAFERYGTRLNLQSKITEKFKIGSYLTINYTEDQFIAHGTGQNEWSGPLYAAYNMDPTMAIRNSDGTFVRSTYDTIDNPVALLEGIDGNSHTLRTTGSFYGEYSFTKNLYAKLNLGGDYANEKRFTFISDQTIEGMNFGGIGTLQEDLRGNYLAEGTLHFDDTYNDIHKINAVGGLTYQRFITERVYQKAEDFPSGVLGAQKLGLGNPERFENDTWKTGYRLASYIARVNYIYNERYHLTATVRADGSSRFGVKNRWSVFPSVALSWNLHQEDFMKNLDHISRLRIRGSWGQTGNQDIGNYPSITTMATGLSAAFNDRMVTSLKPTRMANPNLKWETTETTNFGLDFGLLNERISGSLEYFRRTTYDMLLAKPVPQSSGFSNMIDNIGEIYNEGFELTLNTRNFSNPNFDWSSDIYFSTIRNEVIDLGVVKEIIGNAEIIREGEPLNSFFGWKITGVWQEEDDFSKTKANVEPGALKYLDFNADSLITADDRVILGNSFPDFQLSFGNTFQYKNFELFLLIEGVYGIEMFNNNLSETYFPVNFRRNKYAEPFLNRWTPENPSSKYPSFTDPFADGTRLVNSYSVEDASYTKLRSVRISYRIPRFSETINSAVVYLTGDNLFTFTDYSGIDPAVNIRANSSLQIDRNTFPSARTFMIGLKLGF